MPPARAGGPFSAVSIFGAVIIALLLGTVSGAVPCHAQAQSIRLPNTWLVDAAGGGDFTSIQGAIDSYRVHKGDTLLVRKGVYEEQIKAFKKNLIIRSELPGLDNRPTIERPGSLGILESTVSISGGAFDNFEVLWMGLGAREGSGISVTGPALVTNCLVANHNMGLVGWCASNFGQDHPATFWGCEICHNNVGACTGETEVIYAYNHIHNNNEGFQHAGGSCARVFSNLIESNNGHGMTMVSYHAWANYAEVSNNTICYNQGDGIYLQHRGQHTDSGGRLASPGETLIDLPLCPMIRDNVIYANGGAGILCENLNPAPEVLFACLPQLRSNNVYEKLGECYVNCPPPIDSKYVEPSYDADWYLDIAAGLVNEGSLSLDPGQAVAGQDDRDMVDLGYHFPELVSYGGANTWIVDPRLGFGDFVTIQDAVDHAQPGDVIKVRQFEYAECVLVSADKGDLIIESELPGPANRPTISVATGATGVALAFDGIFCNFHITRNATYSGGGIGLSVTGECRVECCEIDGLDHGVEADGQTDPVIAYNHIHDNSYAGITLGAGSCAQIFSNWLEMTGRAVLLESAPDATSFAVIANNTIVDNDSGIAMNYNAGDAALCPVIRDNIVVWNTCGIICYTEYGIDGGCYPQIRYTNVNFSWYWPGGDPHMNDYINCPPPEGSSRIIMPLHLDPGYTWSTAPESLPADSPCLDAGSLCLEPGATQWVWGNPVADKGILDLGYHHPLEPCPWHR